MATQSTYLDKKILTSKGESTLFEVGLITSIKRGSTGACEIVIKLSYPSRKEQSSQFELWRVPAKYSDEVYETLTKGMTVAIMGHRRATVETQMSLNARLSYHYCVVDTIDILSTKETKTSAIRREMTEVDELLRKATDDE